MLAGLRFVYEIVTRRRGKRADAPNRSPPSGSPDPQPSDRFDTRPASNLARLVGRDSDLKQLRGLAKRNRFVVLHGGAGTGKTRLAVEHTCLNEPSGFWTAGGNSADVTFNALASYVGVDVKDKEAVQVTTEVQRKLASSGSGPVWVIDNVRDLEQANAIINGSHEARLMITTRDQRIARLNARADVASLPVRELSPGDAVKLLSRGLKGANPAELAGIAERVGHLPFALDVLAIRLPDTTPQRALADLEKAPNPVELGIFKEAGGDSLARPESVYAAIVSALDALPDDVRQAISPLGYLADAPIPLPLAQALTDTSGEGEEEKFDWLVGEGRRRSVLQHTGEAVVIHALTQGAIAATNAQGALELAVDRAADWLAFISERQPLAMLYEEAQHLRLYEAARRDLSDDNQPVFWLGIRIGNAYQYLGRYQAASSWTEEVLRRCEQSFGPEHEHTLASRNALANAYQKAGRTEEAIALYERTLETRERVLGPEHPDTLASRNNLAAAYAAGGRTEEAIALLEGALETMERVLGPEHLDTLTSRANLANAYQAAGRTEEAIALYERTLETRERVLGPEDPDTLSSRGNLANAYQEGGRTQEAIELHQGTLETRERVLGPEHPDTLASRNNLANAYQAAGRTEEAMDLHQGTLETRERVLGPEHPDTLASRNNLANAYQAAGRTEEAIALYQGTLETMERALGPEHPVTLSCRNNLATAYHAAGRTEEAIDLFKETLQTMEQVLGSEHPHTVVSRNNLAAAYREVGRTEEAARIEAGGLPGEASP